MELHELHVFDERSGALCRRYAVSDRAHGIRRVVVKRADTAGRDYDVGAADYERLRIERDSAGHILAVGQDVD